MKALFIVKDRALHPYGDSEYEKTKRLKEGEVYEMSYTLKRNVQFHRKYFSLINTAWDYLTENQERRYGNKEAFRKTIQIAAGYYEPVMDLFEQRFLKAPSSIAFDKMTEEEFSDMYERVKDVLFQHVLTHVSEDEFLMNLKDY